MENGPNYQLIKVSFLKKGFNALKNHKNLKKSISVNLDREHYNKFG
jgi:hypothetical protein